MAARTMFKANLEVGDLSVPVRMYAAVEDQRVHFRLLHERDLVPVVQKMVNPITGDEVPASEVRRGLEVAPGKFVVFEPEELAELQPKPDRSMTVEKFVDPKNLAPIWFDRPYFLGPDGDTSAYFALAEALGEKLGVVRWTMRNKRYVGALCVEQGRLALIKLHCAEEVALSKQDHGPASSDLAGAQLALARQLIAALAGDFDPAAFTDERRQLVGELLERKQAGVLPAPPLQRVAAPRPDDLDNALKRSLSDAKDKRRRGRVA